MKRILIAILCLAFMSLACLQTSLQGNAQTYHERTTVSADALLETPTSRLAEIRIEIWTETPELTCGVIVAANAVNLREFPTEHSRVLTWLISAEKVTVIQFGTWWKVMAGEYIGYVKADYIRECE